jgi:hypothetical protein
MLQHGRGGTALPMILYGEAAIPKSMELKN